MYEEQVEEFIDDPYYLEREHHNLYPTGHKYIEPTFCKTCKEQRTERLIMQAVGTVIVAVAAVFALFFLGQLISKLVGMFF